RFCDHSSWASTNSFVPAISSRTRKFSRRTLAEPSSRIAWEIFRKSTTITFEWYMRVGVIDYGVGNLGSVLRALEQLRVQPILVQRAVDIGANDCLILPGVGNFGDCIQ